MSFVYQERIESDLKDLREAVTFFKEEYVNNASKKSSEELLCKAKLFFEIVEGARNNASLIAFDDLYEVSNFKDEDSLERLVNSLKLGKKFPKNLGKLKAKHKNFEELNDAYQKAFCAKLKNNHFDKDPNAATGAKMYVLWLLYNNRAKRAKKEGKEEALSRLVAWGEQMIEVLEEVAELRKHYPELENLEEENEFEEVNTNTLARKMGTAKGTKKQVSKKATGKKEDNKPPRKLRFSIF